MGTEEEFGSFQKFREWLLKNRISIDWDQMTVKYTNSRKDRLEIQYQPGLPIAPVKELPVTLERKAVKGLAESVPIVRINGKREIPYDQWPMIESPYVNLNDNILIIDDGKAKITVNWTGDYPVIRRSGE